MSLNLETRADNRDGPPKKQRCNDAHVCHLPVSFECCMWCVYNFALSILGISLNTL